MKKFSTRYFYSKSNKKIELAVKGNMKNHKSAIMFAFILSLISWPNKRYLNYSLYIDAFCLGLVPFEL